MQRRVLRYGTFGDWRSDIARLRNGPYARVGAWSLGQMCDHLDRVISMSLDGFPFRVPWYFRAAGVVMKRVTLWRNTMPAGVKGPEPMMPTVTADADEQVCVDRLLVTLDRYEQHTGPLHPSPLFGRLTREEWDRIHLIHAAHHFSFLIPDAGNTPADAKR